MSSKEEMRNREKKEKGGIRSYKNGNTQRQEKLEGTERKD